MRNAAILFLAIGIVATSLWGADTDKKSDREVLEKSFAAKLTGAILAGSFSLDGKESDPHKPDRYQIVTAKKISGDDWVVTAKMKVGENELDVPVPIKVYWADDTPVMSLTDLTIPGMGTFTSRVMFHGDRYAGTWQHGEVGGHMWGKIEKPTVKK
jgi:hypothetical protein